MKHLYTLLAVSTLVFASIFAARVVNTDPTSGRAMIKGQECGYYVSSDKKFLHIDGTDGVVIASYTHGLPTTSMAMPEGYTESFNYQDKQGVERICYYKPINTLSKKGMVSDE